MACVEWTQQALDDLDSIISHLTRHSVSNASTKAREKVRYRYLADIDMVFIISVRSHKQA